MTDIQVIGYLYTSVSNNGRIIQQRVYTHKKTSIDIS